MVTLRGLPLHPNTFDVLPRRKRITMFKTKDGWIFKHFFDDSEIFRELANNHNKDLCRFEFKTVGERSKALKLLELRGFEVGLVENLRMLRSAMRRHFADRTMPIEISPYERLSISMACCICLLELWYSGVEKSFATCKQSRPW
jgi:hypothetical protein